MQEHDQIMKEMTKDIMASHMTFENVNPVNQIIVLNSVAAYIAKKHGITRYQYGQISDGAFTAAIAPLPKPKK